jgi:hypothetical protein
MKIVAVYNGQGVILAAVVVDGQYKGPVPVAGDGHKSGTFEVSGTGAMGLDEVAKTFRVDLASQRLVRAKL